VLRLTCLASAMFALSTGFTAHAQTPPAPETASVGDQTREENEEVILKARTVTEDREAETLTAEGDVEVRVGDRVLKADRLVYDRKAQTMRAQGRVQITDADGSVQFADEIEVDEGIENAFATRFSVRLDENTIATASSAIRSDGVMNALEQVIYTGCRICEDDKAKTPTWSLRARRAVQNQDTQMITYQDAVLEIKGVPVIYVPYFAHPDPTTTRRSGFLTPDMGVSSKIGVFYEQPYYLALSPSQDLTVAPMIAARVNPLVKLNYRKRFFSGYLEADGSFTYEQEFDSDGEKFGDKTWRSHLYGYGRFAINETWDWGFGVERQSDDLYDLRYDIDGEDDIRGLYTSQPRQLLTQVFATGQREDFFLETGVLAFQGLRAGDDDGRFPKAAPILFAQKAYDFGNAGTLTADLSAAALFRDKAATLPDGTPTLDSARVSGSVQWEKQSVLGPGVLVRPFAMARGDVYRLDDGGTAGQRDVSRLLGLAGAQASMPFIRRGETVDLIIEPIAMVAYGSEDQNGKGIPNEDSLLFEADETNLFKPDAVSSYDLWEGGARGSLGLSATARFGDGVELSGVVGRRWREKPDPAFSALSNLSGTKSDYVTSVKARLGDRLQAEARMRVTDDMKVDRVDLDASANIWRIRGSARYFRVASPSSSSAGQEGVLLNGSFRIDDRWSAIISQQRNITDNLDIRLQAGLAYYDECSYFSLAYERSNTLDRSLGPSESIQFRFVLTGLGGVAGDEFD